MNCCRETTKLVVPRAAQALAPRAWQPSRVTAGFRGVLERYVAGGACPERSRRNTRGRQEGRPYPWSQQVIHKISGLGLENNERLRPSLYR